jgi:cell division protein FtsB
LPVLLAGLILYLVVSGYGSLMKLNQLAQKRDALVQSNHDLNHTNENLFREITRLKQDPVYLEEIARKEFGLVRADEIIFFLDQEYKKEGNP